MTAPATVSARTVIGAHDIKGNSRHSTPRS